MGINVPLLRHYVEWVKEQDKLPELEREWDQTMWATDVVTVNLELDGAMYRDQNVCGTTYCLAGKVAVDHGWEFIFGVSADSGIVTKDGVTRTPAEVAAEILGLPHGADLFAAWRTAHDMAVIAEELIDEELITTTIDGANVT